MAKRGRPKRRHAIERLAAAWRKERESEFWKLKEKDKRALEVVPPGKVRHHLEEIAKETYPKDKNRAARMREVERLTKHRRRWSPFRVTRTAEGGWDYEYNP